MNTEAIAALLEVEPYHPTLVHFSGVLHRPEVAALVDEALASSTFPAERARRLNQSLREHFPQLGPVPRRLIREAKRQRETPETPETAKTYDRLMRQRRSTL